MNNKPIIVLVHPEHFEVSYAINPWMQPDVWARSPDQCKEAAVYAWHELKRVLERVGCRVEVMWGVAGLPDMVFSANSAVVLDGRAIVARFRYPERRGEEAHFLRYYRALQKRGLLQEVVQMPADCFQEGAGDCLWDATRSHFWAGYGPRSGRGSIAALTEFFGREVVPLQLVSEESYHLDVCFCPLSGGEILYYPPALSLQARHALCERVAPEQLIAATEDDWRHFSVNAINVGRELIMASTTERLRRVLTERGYRLHEVDLAPFMLSGGGAYCMSLRLNRASAGAMRAADDQAAAA